MSSAVADDGRGSSTDLPASVVPYLAVNGGAAALDFYTRAFGARETFRITNDDGTLGHAEFLIGQARFFLADEWPVMGVKSPLTLGGYSVSLAIVVDDADAYVARLADAGATVERAVTDGPEPGMRAGWVIDPFGHRWHISSPGDGLSGSAAGYPFENAPGAAL